MIVAQPDNTEFLLCWKGKYIIGITNVPAEQHFNVRYEYANNAVIAHDFFADDPYPGVLTIDASESSDPTPVADFETELRAFLPTVGVSNVALSRVAQLEWWNTKAAFYEAPVYTIDVKSNTEDIEVLTLEDQWAGVVMPKVTINGVTGYLQCDGLHQISLDLSSDKSCPVPDAVLAMLVDSSSVAFEHTDVVYTFDKNSCSLGDFFMIVLRSSDPNLPDINVELIYDDTRKLRGLFALGSFHVAEIDSPALERLQQGPVIMSVNGVLARITLVDTDHMTTEVLSNEDNDQFLYFNMPTLHGAILCSDFKTDVLYQDVYDWSDQLAVDIDVSNNQKSLVTSGFSWNQVDFAQEW